MTEKILEIERNGEEVVVRFHSQLFPRMRGDARRHVRAAGREMLLALRNFIDVAVEYSESKDQKASHPRTKVNVE